MPPREPIRCPRCALVLASWKCPCGYVVDPRKKSRPVVQADGTLIEMPGDVFRPRVTQMRADTAKLWAKAYWRAKNSKNRMTFVQALGLFCHENYYYPPPDMKWMPIDPDDLYRAVAQVPPERLHR